MKIRFCALYNYFVFLNFLLVTANVNAKCDRTPIQFRVAIRMNGAASHEIGVVSMIALGETLQCFVFHSIVR